MENGLHFLRYLLQFLNYRTDYNDTENNSCDHAASRRIDLDQLKNASDGTYQEAMEYLDYLVRCHGWESRTYGIKHMSDEEYAHYEYLLDN